MRHVIAALVTNEPGVLAQVAGMFAARGFNIDSLVVGRTDTPEISRMTIVVTGDYSTLEQVRKQLSKLVPVVKVVEYHDVPFVERDLTLVQVSTKTAAGPADKREEIITLANLFRAKVVDVSADQLMIEMSGPEAKIEAFIELLEPYGIIELARTGLIAMRRGNISQLNRPSIAQTLSDLQNRDPDASNTAKPEIDPGDLPPG
ncbi:acetolactate synthase small subunit [Planctomycetota bacterium]|nr:acetolactate synthase small subunit [Planctomycetota bacterium]